MRRTSYRKSLLTVALMACGILTWSCESDGPEFAVGGDTRILEGRLMTDEESDTEFFALSREGTVSILASTIRGTDPESGEPIPEPSLAVSVGAPLPEDETQCQLTFSQVLEEGDSFSVFFRDGLYCLSVFRVPGVNEGAEYDWVVTLTGAFS